MDNSKRLVTWTGMTILVCRVLTAVAIYFIGKTPLWANIYSDQWNHYQVGIILLLIAWLLRDRLKQWYTPIRAIGAGLIIDETADVLKLLGIQLGDHFRDSSSDLVLICLTFAIFSYIVLGIPKKTTKQW